MEMKELGRKILDYLPVSISLFIFRLIITLKNFKTIRATQNEVKRIMESRKNEIIDDEFFHNLMDFCVFYSYIGGDKYIESYFNGSGVKAISLKMQRTLEASPNDVILICCVKNDLVRVKKVVEHHHMLGIDKMVFVDNMSDDGTREYLETQDIDLYAIDEDYHAGRKGAWIRQIQDIYGYNRWYLVVDSDELFTYVGMEQHPINDLVKYAHKKGIVRIRSMLLDMYPSHSLYMGNGEDSSKYDFVEDYRFFDSKTYYNAKDGRGYMVRGGPRKRYFEKDMDYSEPLAKYPLFYATIEDIWGDHRPLPFYKNFKSLFLSVLRHYKFMEGDIDKYKEIAENGQYFNGSANYKIYVSSGKDIKFFYEDSKEFINSESLNVLTFLDEIDWAEIDNEKINLK